ncbi:hypothetical protein [Pseudomonas sp. FME51]|uniref:hypothetical protein n=1 Tax=Pseudomonas sp. FME51 TaxID=2742609 RepID=UPI0018670FEB|nr:hypothetical protein [Pseudomonas sp. FME51]
MNRRNFLKVGLAGSSLPILAGFGGHSLASILSGWDDAELSLVISDARFSAPQRFAAAAERIGVRHLAIDGDVTRLWRQHLVPLWRKQPSIIAGMTARQPLFCLEQLGRDYDMRVVLRAEHMPQSDGTVSHQLNAPMNHAQALNELLGGQVDWEERMARYSSACSWNIARDRCIQTRISSPMTLSDQLEVPMVSWVMAPMRRV